MLSNRGCRRLLKNDLPGFSVSRDNPPKVEHYLDARLEKVLENWI